MSERQPAADSIESEAPPFLGTWRRIYIVVLVHLVIWISLLYLFTTVYRPDPV